MSKKTKIILSIILIILVLTFTIFSFQKGSDSKGLSDKISNFINTLFNNKINKNKLDTIVRKVLGHFCFFLIIGIVSTILFLSIKYKIIILYIINLIFGFLFALFTEFVCQNVTSGRNSSFNDVLIDFSGYFLGSLIIFCVKLCKSKNDNVYNMKNM